MMEVTAHRDEVIQKSIDQAIEMLKEKLTSRLNQKGYGTFASRHEVLGIVEEEMCELKDAVRSNSTNQFELELLDIAVGCVFGLACVKQGTLDW